MAARRNLCSERKLITLGPKGGNGVFEIFDGLSNLEREMGSRKETVCNLIS